VLQIARDPADRRHHEIADAIAKLSLLAAEHRDTDREREHGCHGRPTGIDRPQHAEHDHDGAGKGHGRGDEPRAAFPALRLQRLMCGAISR
jgi:hypothetical protein